MHHLQVSFVCLTLIFNLAVSERLRPHFLQVFAIRVVLLGLFLPVGAGVWGVGFFALEVFGCDDGLVEVAVLAVGEFVWGEDDGLYAPVSGWFLVVYVGDESGVASGEDGEVVELVLGDVVDGVGDVGLWVGVHGSPVICVFWFRCRLRM